MGNVCSGIINVLSIKFKDTTFSEKLIGPLGPVGPICPVGPISPGAPSTPSKLI